MHRELGLFSISVLEKGRINEPRADARDLSRFGEIENLIAGSLALPRRTPETVHTVPAAQASTLRATRNPLSEKGSLRDQTVMQKLLQYRDRIPLSSRIIRTGQS